MATPLNRVEGVYGNIQPREAEQLLGVRPLRVFLPNDQSPQNKLQEHFFINFVEKNNKRGGVNVDSLGEANTVFFLSDPTKDADGLLDLKFRHHFKKVSGVTIGVIPHEPPADNMVGFTWEILGHCASQYAVILVGDKNSRKAKKAFILSMEGSHPMVDFEKIGEDAGMDEIHERIVRLAGGEKVTNWDTEFSMPLELWNNDRIPKQIAQAGSDLHAAGLLENVNIGQHVKNPFRARLIAKLLEVTGLSIGNISAWDDGFMQITGSGFDKTVLARKQIVAIRRLTQALDGPMVWMPNGYEKVKPSVETFDQFLTYCASSLIKLGLLDKPDLNMLMTLIADPQILQRILKEGPVDQSIIHLHIDPAEWDPETVIVVEPNIHLVPKGKFHSSCGLMPLAYYTVEELMRAMLEDLNKTKIARLPNHGIFTASPLPLPELVDYLAKSGKIKFREVVNV